MKSCRQALSGSLQFQTFAIKIRILTRIKLWKYSKGGNIVALMRNPRGIPHLGWPKAGLFFFLGMKTRGLNRLAKKTLFHSWANERSYPFQYCKSQNYLIFLTLKMLNVSVSNIQGFILAGTGYSVAPPFPVLRSDVWVWSPNKIRTQLVGYALGGWKPKGFFFEHRKNLCQKMNNNSHNKITETWSKLCSAKKNME